MIKRKVILAAALITLLLAAISVPTRKSEPNEKQIQTIYQLIYAPLTELPPFPQGNPRPKLQLVGVEQYRDLVAKYFPANEVGNALVIMKHESGGNPDAVSSTNDHGLMQIHAPLWTNFFGVTTEQLKNPETNIKLAAVIWRRSGWSAWSTSHYLYGA